MTRRQTQGQTPKRTRKRPGEPARKPSRPAKLWDKGVPLDPEAEAFTVGDDYLLDRRLVRFDCQASQAHVRMLRRIGILTPGEAARLDRTLREILRLDREGKFEVLPAHEDCHTAIENHLVARLGDLGKKIHTGRSRNDQVLTALRLCYREGISALHDHLSRFDRALAGLVRRHGSVRMPGYTHTRKAMPSSVGIWAGAFRASLRDDRTLLSAVARLLDQSPLGTGAGYGVPLPLDRAYTARLLGFSRVQANPLYAQNSRGKFEALLLHLLGMVMADLNRMASDLILFSLPEFGYFLLPEAFCTGSSIMPQKKNPDVLELVRAKYHGVKACESEVERLTANLISGYHRDLQLTKAPTFRGLDATRASLSVMTRVTGGLRVDRERCAAGFDRELLATGEVYRLVKQGVPFREAYRQVARQLAKPPA